MTDEERTRLTEALATLKAALDDLPEMSFAVDNAILDLERLRDGLTATGHTPIKLGDRVLIHARRDWYRWVADMDGTIGKVGLAMCDSDEDGEVFVSIGKEAWWYPAECLAVVKVGE